MKQKLTMGMVGGGEGSFMGEVHRMAARLDGSFDCVAGALSSSVEKARRSGQALGLAPDRIYDSFKDLIERESQRPDRVDIVSVVTPNHRHFAPIKLALQFGFDVVVDKPMCVSINEARELGELVLSTGKFLAVTYTYSAYPALIEARSIVKAGRIGKPRKVIVQYPQGWLSTKIEDDKQKQASWRTDPAQAGPSGCVGDIGTHALQLAEFVSGQHVTELLAELQAVLPGRKLDDDATILMRFNDGLRGTAIVSQVLSGEGNALSFAIYGDQGGLRWTHTQPNELRMLCPGRPEEILVMGAENEYLSSETRQNLRLPSGHPEGYLEAFANIYRNIAKSILARKSGEPLAKSFPDVSDGFRGIALITAAVLSSKNNSVWTTVDHK